VSERNTGRNAAEQRQRIEKEWAGGAGVARERGLREKLKRGRKWKGKRQGSKKGREPIRIREGEKGGEARAGSEKKENKRRCYTRTGDERRKSILGGMEDKKGKVEKIDPRG